MDGDVAFVPIVSNILMGGDADGESAWRPASWPARISDGFPLFVFLKFGDSSQDSLRFIGGSRVNVSATTSLISSAPARPKGM